MLMFILPARPVSWPVPESGITVMLSWGTPRFIVALCSRTKVPVLALERAGDDFEGDVAAGGAFGAGSRGEHGAFAGGFEIAVELLCEEHAADGCASSLFFGGLRVYFDFEGSSGVQGDHPILFCR